MYTSNRVLVVKDAVLVASPMEEKRRQRMRRSVKKGVRLRMFEECFTLRHEETKGGVVVVIIIIVSHSRWSSSSSSSSYGYASESFGYTRNRIENRIRRRDASTLPAAGRPRPRLRSVVVVVVVVVRDVETPLTPRTNTSPGVLRDFIKRSHSKKTLVFPKTLNMKP